MVVCRRVVILVAIVAAGAFGAPAVAQASLCGGSEGSLEYTRKLSLYVSSFTPATPLPGQPPLDTPDLPSTNVGAGNLAREALGAQFAMLWLHNGLQGWVVGLAPGPLDAAAARAAIVERIAAHYTPDETTYLAGLLHIDPQPYGLADLSAVQDALGQALLAEPDRVLFGVGVSCTKSDAFRVELTIYSPVTPEQFLRVLALVEPYGDKVRVELVPHGPPSPGVLVLGPQPPQPQPQGRPAVRPVSFSRHVKMPILRRCTRARQVRVAARGGQPAVKTLSIRSGGRTRTISGKRLARPLVVALRARRTTVAVTVRVADGRAASRTVTYTCCR
jgi:hypothetical protein